MRSSTLARRLLGITIVVAIAALTIVIVRYLFTSHFKNSRPEKKTAAVDVALKSIHFSESDPTGKKWELFAANGTYDKASDRSSLEEIRFIVEKKLSSGPVTLTARHGEYSHASKNVLLKGDVKAMTADGTTFNTTAISYDSARRTMSTNEKVKLSDAALSVEGVGFNFNLDTGIATMHSSVTAVITPGKRGK